MNANVIRAIFKRNFNSYFSNPTGYVFICVFVVLNSLAAFWPNEFFNSNLANLDQLNKYLPYILLVFIPAITMSIWADERRQGTDELLLTIPATDFDVVLGKYLAAVAIYTVALIFSLICNLMVLATLGEPDLGLFLGTYFGYWMVGLGMLAIGMVASFLTGNLTVAYILGLMFNLPLVFAGNADAAFRNQEIVMAVKRWSYTEQFRDFGRGVISLSNVAFFASIVALMLYLAIVLIGRRHWRGGREGRSMAGHYLIRFVSLVVLVVGLNMFMSHHDRLRADITTEQLSSLSPQTRQLIKNLNPKFPVQAEAYISKVVPEPYVQARLNLISTLREFEALGGKNVEVIIHEVEPFSEEASRAEQQYGIRPETVLSRTRGALTQEEIFLGVAFTSGLEKVVVPFVNKGIPVEYELVRSIVTVSQQKRKKIGVLNTDARLFGSFDMQTMSSTQNEMLIDELQKQYELVQVDPSNAITETYDALLAVQPSSLTPPQMDNFVAAVKAGQPTAIFEDPFPYFFQSVPGTAAPKRPAGNMGMFGGQPPQPKGDIEKLWSLLGVRFNGQEVIWQEYNPFPQFSAMITREWVFAGPGSGAKEPFNVDSPITSGLQQVLLLFPGAVQTLNQSNNKFVKLIRTSTDTGTVPADQIMSQNFLGQPRLNPQLPHLEQQTDEEYLLAVRISSRPQTENLPMSDKAPDETKADSGKAPSPKKAAGLNVVLVSDIDCLYSAFFAIRARGQEQDDEVDWDFDNVTFVLNTLDELAGDDRFVEIRKRRPTYRTLTRMNVATKAARDAADKARQQHASEFAQAKAEAQKNFDERIEKLKKRAGLNPNQAAIEVMAAQQQGQRELEVKNAAAERRRDQQMKTIERNLALEIRQVQDRYKMWALLLPPIPPLLVGLAVFFARRAREREGVSKARLR